MALPRTSAAAFFFTLSSLTSVLAVHGCPKLPSTLSLVPYPTLVDPFTFFDGAKVVSKDDWTCRRDEISELFQRLELGTFPPAPDSVKGSILDNKLTINVAHEGRSITFNVSIQIPPSGFVTPFPAIIAFGALSIPAPSGVATIIYNNDEIAAQNGRASRGRGKFYDIYGSSHSAGALVAWAWGVGRIIDALETIPNSHIDTMKLAVTGCSRNGKGVLVAGALEKRIALTIPQESGPGGAPCWRLSEAFNWNGPKPTVQLPPFPENVWFSTTFDKYANHVNDLPFDHHLLAALVAPRGLFIIDNSSMDWLGPESVFGCMKVANKVYQALGIADRMGVSLVGGHNHCQFPPTQQPELDAFVDKFLRGYANANTSIIRTDEPLNWFQEGAWVTWATPTLS